MNKKNNQGLHKRTVMVNKYLYYNSSFEVQIFYREVDYLLNESNIGLE